MGTECGNMYKICTVCTDCMCVLYIQFLTHAPVSMGPMEVIVSATHSIVEPLLICGTCVGLGWGGVRASEVGVGWGGGEWGWGGVGLG